MTTVLLVRHGLTALTGPVLAGWTPGVHLDERGRAQAEALGERLRAVPLAAVVTSPLERCRETADAILAGREPAPPLHVDERVGEVGYGSWTGRELKALRREPLWAVVQGHPSAAVFPDGEGLAEMSARAVAAIRDWNAALGADATYARREPRRRHQGGPRRRAGAAPRRLPADRRRSLLPLRRALRADAARASSG